MKEKTSDTIGDLYVYSLRKGKIASYIAIGHVDLLILKMYKNILRKPMRAILHDMIGTAAKCWEEKHDQQIKELEEKSITDERIIYAYIKSFGRIKPEKA